MPQRGDKKLFGTYWSSSGPVKIALEYWVYDGEQWVMPESPAAKWMEAENEEAHRES